MITGHFDAGIIAGTPATYLTAALLTRLGYKVCLCERTTPSRTDGQFQSYYPFSFYKEGPFIETIRLLGMEGNFLRMVEPLSLQLVLPEGRAELFTEAEKRKVDLTWLFGKNSSGEVIKLTEASNLSKRISSACMEGYKKKLRLIERLRLGLTRVRLSRENIILDNMLQHHLIKIFGSPLSVPITGRKGTFIPSTYLSVFNGESFTIPDVPLSLINFLREPLLKTTSILEIQDATIDPSALTVTVGAKIWTFKIMIFDLKESRALLGHRVIRRRLRFFTPRLFWFPLLVNLRREGYPVGMGPELIIVNPGEPLENGNLLYVHTRRSSLQGAKMVQLNLFSLWNIEILNIHEPFKEIVGTVMDRLRVIMPFIDEHIINIIHPQATEEIPAGYFNYIYELKKETNLFKPAFRSRLAKNVLLVGAELFPHWGVDGEALSALEAVKIVEKTLGRH